jgi:hypothetical protein
MVHIENIPHILQHGITHKYSKSANPDFVPIGDQSLIDARSTKQVTVSNGERRCKTTIILGNFTPFYFGVRMPMLYVVQRGGNFVKAPTPPEKIVYIAYRLVKVIESGNTYYFSDGHATDSFTTFYDQEKIEALPKIINWNAVKEKYWSGEENAILKREKQAEFLVEGDLPIAGVRGYVCYNGTAEQSLKDQGIEEGQLRVWPDAYY